MKNIKHWIFQVQRFPLQPEQYQPYFPYRHGLARINTFSHHFIPASFRYLFRPRTPQQLFLIQRCGAKRRRDRWIWKRKLQQLSKICSYKVSCQIILQLARVAHGDGWDQPGGWTRWQNEGPQTGAATQTNAFQQLQVWTWTNQFSSCAFTSIWPYLCLI